MPAITVSDAAVLHHPAEALILTMTSATALNPELAAVNDALDGGIAQQVTDGHFRPAPEKRDGVAHVWPCRSHACRGGWFG